MIKSFHAGAGSMSPVPIRLPRTEAALVGKRLDAKLIESACGAISAELTPRKSAAWRKKMASNLLRTFLTDVSEAGGREGTGAGGYSLGGEERPSALEWLNDKKAAPVRAAFVFQFIKRITP